MNGMSNNFETTVAFLLPVDPYLKQRNNFNKNAQIVDVNLKGKFQSKTGVHFLWYKKYEYKKLSKEKRAKLYEWQNSKDWKDIADKNHQSSGKPLKVSAKKKLQAKISTLEAQLKVVEEGPNDTEIEACLTSAEYGKPSALENNPVSPKYKAQVLAIYQIFKCKRE